MKSTVILRYTGLSLVMVACIMAACGIVPILAGSRDGAVQMLFSALLTAIAGAYPLIFVHRPDTVTVAEGYFIVVCSWLSACVFGMLPYLLYGDCFSLVNSLFESVSGFTTTGASVVDDVEALPLALKLWRVSSAWVGGIGIVTLFSLLVPSRTPGQHILSGAEMSGITLGQSRARGKSLVYRMLAVYVMLTIAAVIALCLAGLGWLDAVTTAMSAVSTCGFSVRNQSVAAYDSLAVELILSLVMLVSATSFIVIFSSMFRRRECRPERHEVSIIFVAYVLMSTLVVSTDLRLHAVCPTFGQALRQAWFQVCSIATTTGFASADTSVWPHLSIMVIMICSLFCGCSGSTSGGMKTDRAVLALRSADRFLSHLMHPSRVSSSRVAGRVVSDGEQTSALVFMALYITLVVAAALIYVSSGMDMMSGISASVACMGNVGPGFGTVGSMCNYNSLPSVLKCVCMIQMILGRLEILPVVLVVRTIRERQF